MGLTVNEDITLKNGMKVNGAYISFSGQSIGLIPGPSARLMAPVTGQPPPDVVNLKKTVDYTANGLYNIWLNKAAKDAGYLPIESGTVDYPITKDKTTDSIHALLYEYIKTNVYTSATDC
jgi:hypothetical protein